MSSPPLSAAQRRTSLLIDLSLRSAVRTGFLHIAEALEVHRDAEVPLRAVIAMLKAGDRCNTEAELVVKGLLGLTVQYSQVHSNLLTVRTVLLCSAAGPDGGQVALLGGAALPVDDTERHSRLCHHSHFPVAAEKRGGSCEKGSGFQQVSATILFPSSVMQETLIFDRNK